MYTILKFCANTTSIILLLTAGILLLGISSMSLSLLHQMQFGPGDAYLRNPAICILLSGLLLLVTVALGVGAWVRSSRCLAVLFFIVILVAMALEVGSIFLSANYWPKVQPEITSFIDRELKNYPVNSTSLMPIDRLQQYLQCCGVESFIDWNTTDYFKDEHEYPDSCCANLIDEKRLFQDQQLTSCMRPHLTGCRILCVDTIHSELTRFFAISAGVFLLKIVGLLFTCTSLGRSEYQPIPTSGFDVPI